VKLNIDTRKVALRYLADGGAIGIFPGGTVATSRTPFSQPLDPAWRTFTAKMIMKSKATVVPIYFDGHNSRLFQLMSHFHYTLRMAFLINEFRMRVDEPVKIVVGQPIPADQVAAKSDPKEMMDFLRQETYRLSPRPLSSNEYGFEFEDLWRQ
jgi:putative hemolysin